VIPPARQLGSLGIPIFVFHEGDEPYAGSIFRELAKVSNGAYHRFDQGSARQLSELLRAVAVYATGGVKALERQGSAAARLLLTQIR